MWLGSEAGDPRVGCETMIRSADPLRQRTSSDSGTQVFREDPGVNVFW